MTLPFVIRWRPALVVLAGVTALAVNQPPSTSQEPDGPGGRIAIASKTPGVMTVVDLQGRKAREFKVGYLPHEVATAGPLVFLSNYGSAHVRSSDLTNDPGNTLSVVDLSRSDAATEAIDLGPGRCAPHGLAVSRDRQRLYVTCEGRQEVLAVDVKSRRIVHAIPTNQAGSHMLATFRRWVTGVCDELLARHRVGPRSPGQADSGADRDRFRDGRDRPLARRSPRLHLVGVHQ